MEEAVDTLRGQIITTRKHQMRINNRLWYELCKADEKQQISLNRKLRNLCKYSKWNEVGDRGLVENVSGIALSDTQMQVLSLGLKFVTKNGKIGDILYSAMSNTKRDESEIMDLYKVW